MSLVVPFFSALLLLNVQLLPITSKHGYKYSTSTADLCSCYCQCHTTYLCIVLFYFSSFLGQLP
jgi:hypothetical protein